jgi:hypothetical protein
VCGRYTLDFRGFGRSTADSAPEPTAVGFPQLRPSQCAADIVTVRSRGARTIIVVVVVTGAIP